MAKSQERRWATEALNVEVTPESIFRCEKLRTKAFYADDRSMILRMDAKEAAELLAGCGLKVDCIATSPPFYGQRDYEVEGQIGLEDDPQDYIDRLVAIFNAFVPVLKDTGSLWVNLGDTYWSGRGQHRSGEAKQSARRFGLRPQDKRRRGPWTRGKQLLLIPHRFAIAMQQHGWIVRNDNVWVKPNPIPDQVRDRCSISHEYVFHFVRQRFFYFLRENVGRPTRRGTTIPPLDTWLVPPSRGRNGHKATFSEGLITIPVMVTCSCDGSVLDPFGGSGTTLEFAKKAGRRAVGIDVKEEFCELMVEACARIGTETISDGLVADNPGHGIMRRGGPRRDGMQQKTLLTDT